MHKVWLKVPSGSGEDDEEETMKRRWKCEKFTDRPKEGRQAIRKARMSLQLKWAKMIKYDIYEPQKMVLSLKYEINARYIDMSICNIILFNLFMSSLNIVIYQHAK